MTRGLRPWDEGVSCQLSKEDGGLVRLLHPDTSQTHSAEVGWPSRWVCSAGESGRGGRQESGHRLGVEPRRAVITGAVRLAREGDQGLSAEGK